jgi:hypothetical protein
MLSKFFTSSSAATIRSQVLDDQTRPSGLPRSLSCVFSCFLQDFYKNAEQDKFNNFGGIDGRGRKKQDPPIEKDLILSLEECYHGCIKKMKISRRVKGLPNKIRLFPSYPNFVLKR